MVDGGKNGSVEKDHLKDIEELKELVKQSD